MFKKIAKGAGIGLLAIIVAGTGYIAVITPGGLSGFWLMFSTVAGLNTSANAAEESSLEVPQGFNLELVAQNLGYVRFIATTEQDDLVATSPTSVKFCCYRIETKTVQPKLKQS